MPTILLDKCIKCMKCVNDCPSDAIDIDKGSINNTCIHCGHCVAICPELAVKPDFGSIKPLAKAGFAATDFVNLSSGNRSCRSYLKKTVPEDVLHLLIENMKNYSSASNARPVQITVVQSPEKVQALNDDAANSLIKTLGLVTNPIVGLFMRVDTSALKTYNAKIVRRQIPGSSQICHHAPVVMLFHASVTKYGMAKDDAVIWAANTTLYANTLGLGSCFNGFIVKAMERSKALRTKYNIPKGHQVYAAITLGYSKVNYVNAPSRQSPKAEII